MSKTPMRILVESVAQPLYALYSQNDRNWEYSGLQISVLSGIFHPGWFVTSQMLLEKLERLDLAGKSFLELGCGTATQACRAAAKGAVAYASDVTANACKNAHHNAHQNNQELRVIHSDLFDSFPDELTFDFIFVNPPFIPKYPEKEKDFAFFCGEQFEYYHALFESLGDRLNPEGEMIMALAKSCPCDDILEIGEHYEFAIERIDRTQRWAETNYLYAVRHAS